RPQRRRRREPRRRRSREVRVAFTRSTGIGGNTMTRPLKLAKGSKNRSPFAPVEDALAAIRDGKMIVVVDDEDRENEGDLTMAASLVTPEHINFMARHGRGLICLSMTPERLDELEIP